jgi:hypothetical protein
MDQDVDFYRTQSRWSDPGRWASRLSEIPPEPRAIRHAVSGLLLHPYLAPMRGVEVPPAAQDDRQERSVEGILDLVLSRDRRALTADRQPQDRAFCVCAGFARLATAVFRTHGLPARCRAGFAAYFTQGFLEDHWVCEYRDGDRWRLLDAQLDDTAVRDFGISFPPWAVPRDQFIDGSTAWCRARAGELDPSRMGLSGLGLSGMWFAAGEVMLDVAALNKEEMLPWEKWSVGRELGPGATVPPSWLAELDAVAGALAGTPDAALARRVYSEHDWLRVTPTVLSFASGAPVELSLAEDPAPHASAP